jgi:urease accessory protein
MKLVPFRKQGLSLAILVICLVLFGFQPVLAHHPLDGRIPSNFFEGFISGLAHPIIGLDHFAFVVASGLMAIGIPQGILIPIGFVIATLIGTGIHLQSIDLLFTEPAIAISVILFGALLASRQLKHYLSHFYTIVLGGLAIVAGIFHGYAYGEAIVGAQMTPLVAYLSGFAVIQLSIALLAWLLGGKLQRGLRNYSATMRWVGLGISAIGFVFLTQV